MNIQPTRSFEDAEKSAINFNDFYTENVLVDPKTADYILQNHRYAHQRPAGTKNIESLADMMRNGEFLKDSTLYLAKFQGKSYLLNGQHRLNAIKESLSTIRFQLNFYDCKTKEEVHEHYLRIDNHKRRGFGDVANETREDIGCQRGHFQSIGRACALIATHFRPEGGNNRLDEKKNFSDHLTKEQNVIGRIQESREVMAIIRGERKEHTSLIMNSNILAVVLITLGAQKNLAENFWKNVIAKNHANYGTPADTLYDWLNKKKDGRFRNKSHHSAILAWNRYYNGRKLTPTEMNRHMKKVSESNGTVSEIFGTQYSAEY